MVVGINHWITKKLIRLKLKIKLPPLEEQKQIAEILWTV